MQNILNPMSLKVTVCLCLFSGNWRFKEEFKQEYDISHPCRFLRSLLLLIRQYSHTSVGGIRWPFCACSFPIKNVTTVAAQVSFSFSSSGSWVTGGLTCRKSAAVAQPKSHQVHGHSVCRRAPKLAPEAILCHPHPTEICAPTLHRLATMGGLTGCKPKATPRWLIAAVYGFIQKVCRKCS